MTGIFGGPKMPGPDPELKAAQDRQQARLDEEERQKKAAIAARQKARQIGGQRMLLSAERESPQMGVRSILGTEA